MINFNPNSEKFTHDGIPRGGKMNKQNANHPHSIAEYYFDDRSTRIYCPICNFWVPVKYPAPMQQIKFDEKKVLNAYKKAVIRWGSTQSLKKFGNFLFTIGRIRWLFNMVYHYQHIHQASKNLKTENDKYQRMWLNGALRNIIKFNKKTMLENSFTSDDLDLFPGIEYKTRCMYKKVLDKGSC